MVNRWLVLYEGEKEMKTLVKFSLLYFSLITVSLSAASIIFTYRAKESPMSSALG